MKRRGDDAPVEDVELAALQDALVERLMHDVPADEHLRALAADARTAPFAAWVATLDERCVEVTCALMRRWADRAPV